MLCLARAVLRRCPVLVLDEVRWESVKADVYGDVSEDECPVILDVRSLSIEIDDAIDESPDRNKV